MEAFNSRPLQFEPDQIARARAFVSLRSDGTLSIERGHVRPVDEDPATQPVITTPWQAPAEEEEDEGIRPLPDRLLSELTGIARSPSAMPSRATPRSP